MEKCEFKLDKEALELFNNIGGIDTRKRTGLSPRGRGQMEKKLLEQQKRFDQIRVELSRLMLETGRYIDRGGLPSVSAGDRASFNDIGQICRDLYAAPVAKKTVLLRSRGLAAVTRNTESSGYEIIFGDILLNSDVAAAAVKRQGNKARGLLSQLENCFKLYDSCGISSLFLRLPGSRKKMGGIVQALQIIAQYFEAVRRGGVITLTRGSERLTFTPAVDADNNPDPNLTLLTIMNGLKPETLNRLIKKVDRMIRAKKNQVNYDQQLSVYNAIFRIKKLRGQLLRPPIEVNNLKWLVVDNESETISHVKAQVAKFALRNAGGQQGETARILKSVYGKDYAEIDSREVAERLQMSSGLLNSLGKKTDHKAAEQEVVANVEKRLDQVNDDVYDSLAVSNGRLKTGIGTAETLRGNINTRISGLVTFYKKRAVTKRKMKTLVNLVVDFDSQDYETLAEDFAVSKAEAKELIDMLKSCFDQEGNFKKGTFANIVPEFVRYERRIFEFLWHYLKEAIHQTDRTAFINSLQLLVARLKQPKNALKIILDDLCKNSKVVKFADRKAFMLGNLLVRKYNHELVDYQFTPEDVLDVREGLDRSITAYAQWKIGRSSEEIAEKVNTMHRRLLEALDAKEGGGATMMDVPYLIGQEREAMIFFSLVGGDGAGTILFGALNEYGDPGAEIYNLRQSGQHLADLLQMFKVLVRGAGRFEGHSQAYILDQLKDGLDGFKALISAPHIEEMLNQVKGHLGGEQRAFH
ncbi:MAG: hypothetical protein GY697_13080 [Desulfobacterales bacterium]|nr:hypothetical protein [Desulfobacterales bacterium]